MGKSKSKPDKVTATPDVDTDAPAVKSRLTETLEFLAAAAGLYTAFLTWGYMQEKITGSVYRNESTGAEARWEFSYILNILMASAAFILGAVAFVVEATFNPQKTKGLPSVFVFIKPALTNTVASPIGYYALRFINFPMMLLAKSCKLVPVMFMGWVLSGETYSRAQILAVAAISLGVALFTIKPKDLVALGLENVAAQFMTPEKLAQATTLDAGDGDTLGRRLIGLALVTTNLLFDGYTNSAQKAINDKYKTKESGAPSPFFTMMVMNMWGVLMMASWLGLDLGLAAQLGEENWRVAEVTRATAFIEAFPQVWMDLALFSLANAVGQLFIFHIIRAFSPVVLVTLTVTRKFFSVLVSILRFGHHVYPWQFLGMGVLFAGLVLGDTGGTKKGKKKAD